MQDSILFWNAVALEANRVSQSDADKRQQNGPTLASRALAIVHLAMYDAYARIVDPTGTAGFPRYLVPPPAPPVPPSTASSARDAVAGAAHKTLSALYSAQKDFFDAQLSCFDRDSESFEFGQAVGQYLLKRRANDMDARDCGYVPSLDRGRHRRDPDNPGQGFHAPFYGAQTKTFAVSERHDLDAPPVADGADPKYLCALEDVRARGIRPDLTATLPEALFKKRRTTEDTLIGIYWGYDGAKGLGTPPRLYNQIIRQVAVQKNNNEGENARLFAFVNAAMGDAGILAWEQKYCYDYWRPVVGIREHDKTFGPLAPFKKLNVNFKDGDPGWLPLGAPSTNSSGMKNFTPDFPAYPSGHATFGAAAFHITRLFYGIEVGDKCPDDLFPLSKFFVSDEFNGGNRDNDGTVRPRHTRSFPDGLWGMIIENARSRIPLGVHWLFDAFDFKVKKNCELVPDLTNERIGGVGLGLRIAEDVFVSGNCLAPKMIPNAPDPPIITPDPNSPMPAQPKQPASIKGCADKLVAPGQPATAAKSGKKLTTEGAILPEAFEQGQAPAGDQSQGAWPSGISEQDQNQPGAPGAWPSGISEQ